MEHFVTSASALAAGEMKAFTVGGRNIVLFRHLDGGFSALEDRCSHADVKLSRGSFSGVEVECPAHGARFDVCSGRPLCMPAVSPVRSFEVKLKEGQVLVEIP